MLIAQKLWSPFHLMVRIYGKITTVMYSQQKNEDQRNKEYLTLSPHDVAVFPWKIAASVLLAILILFQIVYEVKFGGDIRMGTIVPSMLFFLSLVTHIPQLIVHYNKRHELCTGFNAFIEFERRHNANGWLPREAKTGSGHRNRRYIYILLGIGITVPLSHWKNQIDAPCFPGNAGYMLLSECSGNLNPTGYEKTQKVLMSTCSALLYLFTTATTFIQYDILLLQPYCITNYLRLFLHKLDNQIGQVSNGFKSSKEIDKLFLMYREIEVLASFFNWFHGNTLMVFYVLDSSTAFTISLYVVLGLYKDMPFVAVLNCGILVFLAISALKDFDDYKRGVFQVSKGLISKVSGNKYLSTRKVYRREIKSWRVLRIYMGSTNYYDELTPLNLGHNCVQNTVTLLLM